MGAACPAGTGVSSCVGSSLVSGGRRVPQSSHLALGPDFVEILSQLRLGHWRFTVSFSLEAVGLLAIN